MLHSPESLLADANKLGPALTKISAFTHLLWSQWEFNLCSWHQEKCMLEPLYQLTWQAVVVIMNFTSESTGICSYAPLHVPTCYRSFSIIYTDVL